MKVQELLKWAARYLGWYLLIIGVLIGIGVFRAEFNDAPGYVLTVFAASMTLNGFLKHHDALPDRLQYWQLVSVGTATSVIIDAIRLGLLINATPNVIPAATLALALPLEIVITFLVNMLGFSKSLFGERFLQRVRQKRQRAAARALRKGNSSL